jgi:hypothetical protein
MGLLMISCRLATASGIVCTSHAILDADEVLRHLLSLLALGGWFDESEPLAALTVGRPQKMDRSVGCRAGFLIVELWSDKHLI